MTNRVAEQTRLRQLAESRWTLPTIVFAVASALVSLGSWNVSIWTDEAVTISAGSRSLSQLWALIQHIDAVHGIYYAFMSVWIDVFGISEFWLRLPSALAFGGTIVGVLVLTRRIATPTTAVVAAVICATLPRMAWGAVEARPFVFSALAAVWASWALLRATQRPRASAWILFGALSAVAVLINIYLALVVIAHGVTVLIAHRRQRRVWLGYLISAASAAFTVTPLLLLVRSQQAQLGGTGDRNPLSILRKILINQVFLGETPSADALPAVFGMGWQGAAIVAAVIGIALVLLGMTRPGVVGDDKRAMLTLALPWLILPTLVIAAYAVVVSPVYQPRYFTFTAPAAAILLALGFRSLRRRWIAVSAIVVYACAVLIVIASQRTPFAKAGSDWAMAADVISQQASPGDAVYFAPRYDPATTRSITLTARRIAQAYPDDFINLHDLTLIQTGAETGSLDGFSAPLDDRVAELADYDTVWMLYGNHFPSSVTEPDGALLEAAGFTPMVRWSGPGSTIVEYQRAR